MRFFPGRASGCRPGPGLSIVLLTLACDGGGEPRPPIERSPAVSDPTGDSGDEGSGPDTGDGTDPVGPGSWDDPILRVGSLDVVLTGVELTDAALLGNTLLLAGQQQAGDGGMWKYDLSDRDAPVLTGKSRVWHAQRVCISSETLAWGTDRGGRVVPYDLSGPDPLPGAGISGGGWDHGLDCTETRIAWGEGADGGVIGSLDGRQLRDPVRFDVEAIDVLLDGERLWVVSSDALVALDLSTGMPVETGRTALSGYCGDIAPLGELLAVACGAGGVHLIDPGSGTPEPVGTWRGHASARRVSAAGADQLLVAAWSELLLLDVSDPSSPRLVASEPAESSVMSVVGDGEGRAFVADWNSPFWVSLRPTPAPEVRASMRHALPGAVVQLFNDGREPLWLGTPSAGTVDRNPVAPGEAGRWLLPEDLDSGADIATDDPDEPEVRLVPAGLDGPVVGAPAPGFIESDLSGTTWDLAALQGQVVFLGMFQDGCPVCSSQVPGVEASLRDALADEEGRWPEGFVRLWAYDGPASRARGWAEQYDIAEPVLADGDRSMRQDYFVPNGDGAFAANPRHYVIDRQGRLVFLSTTVAPGDLMDVIETALAEPQEDGADRASVSR